MTIFMQSFRCKVYDKVFVGYLVFNHTYNHWLKRKQECWNEPENERSTSEFRMGISTSTRQKELRTFEFVCLCGNVNVLPLSLFFRDYYYGTVRGCNASLKKARLTGKLILAVQSINCAWKRCHSCLYWLITPLALNFLFQTIVSWNCNQYWIQFRQATRCVENV